MSTRTYMPILGAEPVAWEAPEGLGIVRFVSDRRYQLFSPKIRAYYKPYRCSQCTAPPHTAEVEKKAARYDWLRNDATHDQQDRWLMRLPEQADEYADKRIAALQSDQAQAGKGE